MLDFTYDAYRAEIARLRPHRGPRGPALAVGLCLWAPMLVGAGWVISALEPSPRRFALLVLVFAAWLAPLAAFGRWVRAAPFGPLAAYANGTNGYDEWLNLHLRRRVLEQFRSAQDAVRILPLALRAERLRLRRLRPRSWGQTALATAATAALGYMWREVYLRLSPQQMVAAAVAVSAVLLGILCIAPSVKELFHLEWRRRSAYQDLLAEALLEARYQALLLARDEPRRPEVRVA